MHPREPNEADLAFLGGNALPVLFKAPEGMPDCADLATFVNVLDTGQRVIRIPWQLTVQDLDMLQRGGTIWLSIFSPTMPPVSMDVQEPLG